MNTYWGYSKDIFDQGYLALRRGVFILGGALVALAVLIFLFPMLIAFIFAAVILFAGISALVLGYKIWKLKNQVRPFEWIDDATPIDIDIETPRYVHRRITFILR